MPCKHYLVSFPQLLSPTIPHRPSLPQIPSEYDTRCLFKGFVERAGVGDVQYASVSLLEGTRGGAQLMLDLAGDNCRPPTEEQMKVGTRYSYVVMVVGRLAH